MANLVNGVFNVVDDRIEMVEGPPLSAAVLHRLRDIAQQARDEAISPEQAIGEAAAVDPFLGALLGRFILIGVPALALLVALISLHLQSQAFELQKEDSRASAAFYAAALDLLAKQSLIATSTSEDASGARGADREGSPQTEARTDQGPTAAEDPSKRRREVNRARGKNLTELGRTSGGARNRREIL